jgi:hypothetical protein
MKALSVKEPGGQLAGTAGKGGASLKISPENLPAAPDFGVSTVY